MLLPEYEEPTSVEMVADWVAQQRTAQDRFGHVYSRSEMHRAEHGPSCDVYPTSSGALLGVLARVSGARRMLEVGCGLGYSALWLLDGGGTEATIDSCEADAEHARLARAIFEQAGASRRVTVLEASAATTVTGLSPEYDLIFVDGDPGEYPAMFEDLVRLLRAGGLLISSNLFLGVHVPDAPYLAAAAQYREALLRDPRLNTAFLPGGLALSLRA